jgi:MtN3 and saliva related transmembrane protein
MMEIPALVGAIGATASVASFTPQAWRIIRARDTEGLSAGMYVLTAIAFAAWCGFGVLKGEWALILPNAICLLFALFILVMILLPKAKAAKVAEALDPVDQPPGEQGEA